MDDQDWINLQQLLGRGPQPWSPPPDTPPHILLADALEAYGQGQQKPVPSPKDWADALEAYSPTGSPSPQGQASSPPDSSASAAFTPPQYGSSPDLPQSTAPDPNAAYAMGSPADVDLLWQTMADQDTPAPAKPQPPPAAPAPVPAQPAIQTTIDPIPGYDETGANAWRKANDQTFLDAVNRYNAANGYRPGDPGYWTADMLKAQAMVESGSNKGAFFTDPLQVNTLGNWDRVNKPKVTGLTSPHQPMTPAISAGAALKWLQFKGFPRDNNGKPRPYIGDEGALWRYSGDIHLRSYYTHNPNDSGLTQQDWYAGTIPKLAQQAEAARALPPGSQ